MKINKEIVKKMIEEYEERVMILNGCIIQLKSIKVLEKMKDLGVKGGKDE